MPHRTGPRIPRPHICPSCDGAKAYQRGWYGGFYICGRCNGLGRVTEAAWQRWAHPPPPPRWTATMVPKGGTVDSPGCIVLRGLTAKEARDWAEHHHGSDAWDVALTRDTTQPRTTPGSLTTP